MRPTSVPTWGLLICLLPLGCHDSTGPSGPDLRNHILFIGDRGRGIQAYAMRPDGSAIMALTDEPPGAVGHAKLSPDRTRLAYDYGSDIFVLDLRDSSKVNLTNSVSGDIEPAWSPDGKQIVFITNRDGPLGEVYVMNADGTNPRRLTNDTVDQRSPAWSPDGGKIAVAFEFGDTSNIFVMDTSGANETNVTPGFFSAFSPAWSHDGTRISYAGKVALSDSGYLFIMNADGSGKRQVRAGLNPSDPDWSPDGSELVFDASGPRYIPDIFTIRTDGTGFKNITNDQYFEVRPQWIP